MTDLIARFQQLAPQLLSTPALSVLMTLIAYFVGVSLFRKLKQPVWCPPVLIAAVLLAIMLSLLSISFEEYRTGANWLSFLLGPATVALGVPLYQQFHHIRAMWRPILATVPLAATVAVLYALVIAWALGASTEVLASLAPKSVTAPIAIGINQQIGGSVSLLMGSLLVTGVVASLFVDWLSRWLNISDDRLIGLTLGINGHAIGTVRAFEISATAGAFSSLGMGLTGVFTALLLPFALDTLNVL
ncbi:LrgB family protein [Marinobacter zhejiangensis]|uniref:TIGR00659 family protein n=1 Tax=Marinobacter zhejiangensis TaxID=488535 RepID=A0A1I4Q6P4_9GAMM|nr:LrgB family protein [Marinobacter zhejiangensis]SFM35739.1 TIGR00659 family protein [Marinobacter zhejiangensis]